jgi:hypothetical protein
MVNLPKSYIRVARDITGYWGTYPPSLELKPGVIGRVLDGMFVKEGLLSQFPGYNPKTHADQEEPERNSVSLWNTRHVSMNVFGVDGSAPAANASAGIRMQFGAANEAAIICIGNAYRSFVNLGVVKSLMMKLLEDQEWDRGQCIVTEVLATKKAWICFSTAKDQTAELHASTSLIPGVDPLGILKAAGGHAEFIASTANSEAAGYKISLPDGGTPLFRAIQFRRDWTHPFSVAPEYLRGSGSPFEEPDFGPA